MAEAFHWTCPYCGRDATIRDDDVTHKKLRLSYDTERTVYGDAHVFVFIYTIACPNIKCLQITLRVHLVKEVFNGEDWVLGDTIQSWNLLPESTAKPQPDFIPAQIRDNYLEACRIRDLSPKASATLSRRCMQGIIRDFWQTSVQPTLWAEIEAISDKLHPSTLDAIHAVREIGNIGAHMEQDVNLIVDVEPEEAQALIDLIEMLFEDWYVDRHEREQRTARVIALGRSKKPAIEDDAENDPKG